MANMELSIPHQLDENDAAERVKTLLQKLKQEHQDIIKGVEESWEGRSGAFHFIAKGFKFSGQIKVRNSRVDIHARIPFAVSLFSKKITEIIRSKASQLLAQP